MKTIFLILYCLVAVLPVMAQPVIPHDLAIDLEKTELYYQKLIKEYNELKAIDQEISPEHAVDFIEDFCEELQNELMLNPRAYQLSIKKYITQSVQEIKVKAKVLARSHGLAISISFLTIELTELPMKAVAVAIGHPVVIFLYEFLQPGILVPAITIGIKSFIKDLEMKNLFKDRKLYRQWKKKNLATKKYFKIRNGNEIAFYKDHSFFVIKKCNLGTQIGQQIGLFQGRLDYSNLKRQLRSEKVDKEWLKTISKSHLEKQLKVKMILDHISKESPELFTKLTQKYSNYHFEQEYHRLDDQLTDWMILIAHAKGVVETKNALLQFPRSLSPLLLIELWSSQIMTLFFKHNESYYLRDYRHFSKKFLPLIVKLRKQALQTGEMPQWTEQLEQDFKNYFSHLSHKTIKKSELEDSL